ncbi:uncharacterized protein LOC142824389 isoform X3 [Pelodiscus sinensis]|uniref:uncharacterized protein LOC142824389 isoform X3 n=1 Tax=Pelodiscus sinensis TaxID=13735 RepID=UPI003F6CB834
MAQGLNGQPVSPVQIFSQRAPTSPWEALRFSPQMDARGIWAVLLALAWLGKRSSAHQTSVERPRNLQIIDPGLLGYLHLEWLPPPSLPTLDQCTVKYKLKYRSTGDADWQDAGESILCAPVPWGGSRGWSARLGTQRRRAISNTPRGQGASPQCPRGSQNSHEGRARTRTRRGQPNAWGPAWLTLGVDSGVYTGHTVMLP